MSSDILSGALFFRLGFLFPELPDPLVDLVRELQFPVDAARLRVVWLGADGELLLRLPLENSL